LRVTVLRADEAQETGALVRVAEDVLDAAAWFTRATNPGTRWSPEQLYAQEGAR
jgi:hypothetical protein